MYHWVPCHPYDVITLIAFDWMACSISVPGQDCKVYADQQLAPSSWAKALAWAVSLESARARAADAEAAAAAESSTSPAATSPSSAAVAESSSEDSVPLAQQKNALALAGKSASPATGKPPGAQVVATNGMLRCACGQWLRMCTHADPTT
jgi:hypothetical protein